MKQRTDRQGRPVRFIRKGGRVIPIRVKSSEERRLERKKWGKRAIATGAIMQPLSLLAAVPGVAVAAGKEPKWLKKMVKAPGIILGEPPKGRGFPRTKEKLWATLDAKTMKGLGKTGRWAAGNYLRVVTGAFGSKHGPKVAIRDRMLKMKPAERVKMLTKAVRVGKITKAGVLFNWTGDVIALGGTALWASSLNKKERRNVGATVAGVGIKGAAISELVVTTTKKSDPLRAFFRKGTKLGVITAAAGAGIYATGIVRGKDGSTSKR